MERVKVLTINYTKDTGFRNQYPCDVKVRVLFSALIYYSLQMHKILLVILIISSLFARKYIAIIDFEGIGVTEDEAKALTQRLTSVIYS